MPPTPIVLLLLGLGFLIGFVVGMTVELANLRFRERQLARGRRVLAARTRGLHQQLVDFYRLRDATTDGHMLPGPFARDHDARRPE